MKLGLPSVWTDFLSTDINDPAFSTLLQQVNAAYQNHSVFPPQTELFTAFDLCTPSKLRVVIIGQDPYHKPGQAHGLSFSVNDGIAIPPSLKNIFEELKTDIPGFVAPSSGNLRPWAKQGVLLLNAILTVEQASPGSHRSFGWERFTDTIIKRISDLKEHVVFLLWGNYAISKAELIDGNRHLVLKAAHPSPLARGAFFGCRHFSKTNNYLISKGIEPINWQLYLSEQTTLF